MEEIIKMQSAICRAFSNPARIKILKHLCKGEKSASELIALTGLSKANLSQHMTMLLDKTVVNSRKKGTSVIYSLENPKIVRACELMGEAVAENLKKRSDRLKKTG